MKYMEFVVAFLLALPAVAAIPAHKAPPVTNILAGEGSVHGGIAGSGFSLMDLRKTADTKKKIERLVFDVGNRNGAAQHGWPGYYHVQLQKNPQRLVIDFAQMPTSLVTPTTLRKRLTGSMAVTGTSMSLDPVDNSLNVILDLKKDTRVRVYQVAGKKSTSKVVVDLLAR